MCGGRLRNMTPVNQQHNTRSRHPSIFCLVNKSVIYINQLMKTFLAVYDHLSIAVDCATVKGHSYRAWMKYWQSRLGIGYLSFITFQSFFFFFKSWSQDKQKREGYLTITMYCSCGRSLPPSPTPHLAQSQLFHLSSICQYYLQVMEPSLPCFLFLLTLPPAHTFCPLN